MLPRRIPTSQARPAIALLIVGCLLSFALGQRLGYTLHYPVLRSISMPSAHVAAQLGARVVPPTVRQAPIRRAPTAATPRHNTMRASVPPALPTHQRRPAASVPLVSLAVPVSSAAPSQGQLAPSAARNGDQGNKGDKQHGKHTGQHEHAKQDKHAGKNAKETRSVTPGHGERAKHADVHSGQAADKQDHHASGGQPGSPDRSAARAVFPAQTA